MLVEERSRSVAVTLRLLMGISALALMLLGCGGVTLLVPPSPTPIPTWTAPPLPSETPAPSVTPIYFPTHSPTVSPSETLPPTATFTPTLTLEPQPVMQGPGEVIVPILLYHHIGFSLRGETVYTVSPEAFDQQMNLLYQWGYKSISVETLARALKEGALLPPRPVLLTFDDGSETTYSRALPIMQKYGFTGVAYIVRNYVGVSGHLSADQIRGLSSLGWEIGSHGLSHIELTSQPRKHEAEVIESRRRLEKLLGVPVLSFAYPFGVYDDDSLIYVRDAGYIAAMGLGKEALQTDLFYLSRQPVKGTDDLRSFSMLLPWRAEIENVTPAAIVP